MIYGISEVIEERRRQIEKGYTEEHDRENGRGHIQEYITQTYGIKFTNTMHRALWVELGALCMAEIDRVHDELENPYT